MAGRKRANGEGSISQYPDGRWAARLTLPDGRRKAFYGSTRREVQEKLTAALTARQQGQLIPTERETTAQFLQRWLADVVKPGVRPRTYEAYGLNVRRLLPHIGKTRLATLSPAAIQAAYGALLEKRTSQSGKGLSRRSVEQAHTVLHTALRYAVRARLIPFNPSEAATPPRPERQEMQTLDAAQVQQLIQTSTSDRLHALWTLLATTGLRLGEATGLRWDDLELTTGRLTVRRALQRQRGNGQWLGLGRAQDRPEPPHHPCRAVRARRSAAPSGTTGQDAPSRGASLAGSRVSVLHGRRWAARPRSRQRGISPGARPCRATPPARSRSTPQRRLAAVGARRASP
jgi:integrase